MLEFPISPRNGQLVEGENLHRTPAGERTDLKYGVPIFVHYSHLVILPEIPSALLVAGNILVLIFSFCGGCAALVVCTRSKFARPGTRYFLISLALSDFILASFSIVSELSQILNKYNSWILGHFMCVVSDWVTTFAMYTSGCCIIAISVDRYLAVVRGLKKANLSPKCSSYLRYMFMILVWGFPMAITAPLLFTYYLLPFWVWEWDADEGSNVSDNKTYVICAKKENLIQYDKWYHVGYGVMFLALIITFIFSYVSILVFIKRNFHQKRPGEPPITVATTTSGTTHPNNNHHNNNMGEQHSTTSGNNMSGNTNTNSQQQQQQPQNRQRKTVRLIMALIILFLFCRIPVWVFRILATASVFHTNETTKSIFHSLILLSNVKCAINPFLYTIKNEALRSQNHGIPGGNQQRKSCCCCFPQRESKLSWKHIRESCCWNKGKNLTSYDFTRDRVTGDSQQQQRFYASDKTELPVKSSSFYHSKNDVKTTDSTT